MIIKYVQFYENFNKRLDAIKVCIENLKKPVVNTYINDTELIKKSKAKMNKWNKYSSDIIDFIENSKEVMENTKPLNNVKIRMKNLKVFLQRDSDNINSNVLIEKSNEKTNIRLDNINVRINNLKVFLHGHVENINIKKEVSVNIENNLKSHRNKVYGNIKKIYGNNEKEFELIKNENNRKIKRNNFTRSDICYIKKVISANKNTIKKQPISIDKNRKVKFNNIKKIYANAEKETIN